MHIVIIGAGQLGSRHLQALNLVNVPLDIHIIDPSLASLQKAVEIFNGTGNKHPLKTYTNLDQLTITEADIAVIATNSLARRVAVEQLAARTTIKYLILEKFLFPALEDYDAIGELLRSNEISAWVNCPRRMFDNYKEIKKQMTQTSVISISGSLWGLGCNGIHMLDLVAFLTGEQDMKLNADMVDTKIIESKRAGYIEFTGKITGHTASKRHNFTIASYGDANTPFVIYIQTGEKNFVIFEGTKKLLLINGASGASEEKVMSIAYQSQLTNRVVEQLANNGNCELTPYHESASLHKQFLSTLLNFMSSTSGKPVEKCLIT